MSARDNLSGVFDPHRFVGQFRDFQNNLNISTGTNSVTIGNRRTYPSIRTEFSRHTDGSDSELVFSIPHESGTYTMVAMGNRDRNPSKVDGNIWTLVNDSDTRIDLMDEFKNISESNINEINQHISNHLSKATDRIRKDPSLITPYNRSHTNEMLKIMAPEGHIHGTWYDPDPSRWHLSSEETVGTLRMNPRKNYEHFDVKPPSSGHPYLRDKPYEPYS